MHPRQLVHNERFYILTGSIIASVLIWLQFQGLPPALRHDRLSEIYGLIALAYVYVAVLASPLTRSFPQLPLKARYLHARRAIGVSGFWFALLHSWVAFSGQLGGWSGLSFLSRRYLWSILIALPALVILAIMAATSFDWAVAKLTFRRWKRLHRLVYVAGILIIVHGLLLGSHFGDLGAAIPRICFLALIFLLALESLRLDKYLVKRFPKLANIGVATMLAIHFIILGLGYSVGAASGRGLSLNQHAQHLQIARQNQALPTNLSIAAGDPTKRYTVSFIHPDTVTPGQPANLSFEVFDASSGLPVTAFLPVYTRTAHLVITDDPLVYYDHIHPQLAGNKLNITTAFPTDGRYHLYLNYQPVGAIEQQVGFTLQVDQATAGASVQPIDQNLTKTVGAYRVTIDRNQFSAADLSAGRDRIKFRLTDATGQPLTNLKPYLGAFGHLVMVNQQTYDYIHIHPAAISPPAESATAGPDVEFLPLGLYGPIKPGNYRVFAQFNPNGQLITADFTVKLQ